MTTQGILVVESDDQYQIIGAVSSVEEAVEMAQDYIHNASPDSYCLPPEQFVIQSRDTNGFYTLRTELDSEQLM